MGLGSLRENQLVRWNDSLLKLVGRSANGEWLLTDQVSGLLDHQPESVLWLALERGELSFVGESDELPPSRTKNLLNQLSNAASYGSTKKTDDVKQSRGVHRQDYLKVFLKGAWAETEDEIKALWAKKGWPPKGPPSRATLYLWKEKAALSSDPVSALQDKDELKGRRVWYPEKTLDILRDIRDQHYLKRNPTIRISKAVEFAQNKITLLNNELPPSQHHKIPGRRAMVSVINEIPAFERLASRFSFDHAKKLMRASLGGVETTRPLERVELDHTLISVVLFDEDFTPWGRADTTLALDAHTKCVPGLYWGAETDSIVSLAHCIRGSVQPKIDLLSKYPDVEGTLPCFGVAESYVADNCFAAFATPLRQAASEMGGGIVEFCPRAQPWFKPNVERHFRTQDVDLFHTLPATTMENITRRYDFNIKKDMLLRKSTFDRIYMKWLVDIYHRKPQAGLNNISPVDAWKKELGLFDQFVPTKTILLERLFLRQSEGRDGKGHRLDHEGIEFDCLIYNSAEMGVLRASLGQVLKVRIRVSDEDLGYIYVEVPNHDIWIRVPCLDLAYAKGLTRWQHDKRKKMRQVLKGEGIEISLAEAGDWILKELEAEKEAFLLAVRKRSSRYKEKHSGAKPSVDQTETSPDPGPVSASAEEGHAKEEREPEQVDEESVQPLETDVVEETL